MRGSSLRLLPALQANVAAEEPVVINEIPSCLHARNVFATEAVLYKINTYWVVVQLLDILLFIYLSN